MGYGTAQQYVTLPETPWACRCGAEPVRAQAEVCAGKHCRGSCGRQAGLRDEAASSAAGVLTSQ